MESLISKFVEEKESLALSLSDRLSKHKIEKIANDIEQINQDEKSSDVKAQVKYEFKEQIAELDKTLQKTKEENTELKEKIASLVATIEKQKHSEQIKDDKIDQSHMVSPDKDSPRVSSGRKLVIGSKELKIYEKLELPDNNIEEEVVKRKPVFDKF